jgi:hypothetical protein
LRHREAADPPGKIWTRQPLTLCSYGVSTYHYDYLPVTSVPSGSGFRNRAVRITKEPKHSSNPTTRTFLIKGLSLKTVP